MAGLTCATERVEDTIESTREYPEQLALKGEINLQPHQVAMKIGELFIVVRPRCVARGAWGFECLARSVTP